VSEAKHSAGPWIADKSCLGRYYVEARNVDTTLRFDCDLISGYTYGGNERTSDEEMKANARLMAASPDMLDALRLAESFILIELGCRVMSSDPEPTQEEYVDIADAEKVLDSIREAIDKSGGDSLEMFCLICAEDIEPDEAISARAANMPDYDDSMIHKRHVVCGDSKCAATLATGPMYYVEAAGEHFCEAHHKAFVPKAVNA
jgi:hypothetical protein